MALGHEHGAQVCLNCTSYLVYTEYAFAHIAIVPSPRLIARSQSTIGYYFVVSLNSDKATLEP
jgi:hypothetical protein